MSISKAYTALATLRPKLELSVSLQGKLKLCASFIAAQTQADKENKLGPQVTALSAANDSILTQLEERGDLVAKLKDLDGKIARNVRQLETALEDYSRGAVKLAGNDAVLLGALGVESTKKRAPNGAHPTPDAPTGLVIQLGARPGEVLFKCHRSRYAGAYVFQYKLEPSLPTDPWLPDGEGLLTRRVSATVSGLAPSQMLRARVRAIGDQSSVWSEEVLGQAR